MFFRLVLSASLISFCAALSFWICECGNSAFLGEYKASEEKTDGTSSVFSNSNGMSIYRNQGFWYVGNLEAYPKETHYRCVPNSDNGCTYGSEEPPLKGTWTVNKAYGIAPAPLIQNTACTVETNEL